MWRTQIAYAVHNVWCFLFECFLGLRSLQVLRIWRAFWRWIDWCKSRDYCMQFRKVIRLFLLGFSTWTYRSAGAKRLFLEYKIVWTRGVVLEYSFSLVNCTWLCKFLRSLAWKLLNISIPVMKHVITRKWWGTCATRIYIRMRGQIWPRGDRDGDSWVI